jgi:hypothetical protein
MSLSPDEMPLTSDEIKILRQIEEQLNAMSDARRVEPSFGTKVAAAFLMLGIFGFAIGGWAIIVYAAVKLTKLIF